MTDIVERLRKEAACNLFDGIAPRTTPLLDEAADELDRLRGLLREAQPFIGWSSCPHGLLDRIDAVLAADSAAPVHSHCGKPLKVANGCCVWCGYSDAETVDAVEGEK